MFVMIWRVKNFLLDIYIVSITYYDLPYTPERETNPFYPTPRSFLLFFPNGLPFCVESYNDLAICWYTATASTYVIRIASNHIASVLTYVYVLGSAHALVRGRIKVSADMCVVCSKVSGAYHKS
jgi:hypothetical protein